MRSIFDSIRQLNVNLLAGNTDISVNDSDNNVFAKRSNNTCSILRKGGCEPDKSNWSNGKTFNEINYWDK